MKYYCIIKSDRHEITGIPPRLFKPEMGGGGQAWPGTPEGIQAMAVWAYEFTNIGESVDKGELNVYEFDGPDPVIVPFRTQTLNRVDPINARKLSQEEYEEAVKILEDEKKCDLVNMAYLEYPTHPGDLETTQQFEYGLGECIEILSNALKTVGPIVQNGETAGNYPGGDPMGPQVVVFEPMHMTKMDYNVMCIGDLGSFELPPGIVPRTDDDVEELPPDIIPED